MTTYMTATEARKKFYPTIAKAKKPGYHITITHDGLPTVVMMSFEEFEGWQETIDILSDPEEAAALREAMQDLKKGGDTVSLEEFKKSLKL